ncbi:MAG: magnesium/cobalt transporter CorA [Chloroflexi bacterium]|nr:magnesium/cobalt transporter CorA [Chloroflexota bacterium]
MSISQIPLDNGAIKPIATTAVRPRAGRGTIWLDVSAPSDEDLAWLVREYKFHPLAIEDCKNFNQRAKVEDYSNYLFLSFTTSTLANGELVVQEMEAFLGPNYLITVHREPLPALDAARKYATNKTRADFLLYLFADHMTDAYFPLLDEIDDEIDTLEDQILENPTRETLQRIFTLKQQLIHLRKVTGPMREVMNRLAGTRDPMIDARTALYFRDVYDHLTRIYELIETSRDLLGNALDAYLSTVSNRLNEVMKRLTLFTTVFMPISFLVGFAGINFQQMPFDNPTAFSILLATLVIFPSAMLIWFVRSKWV